MYTCTKGDICKKKSHRNLKLSETKMCNKNIKYSIFDSVEMKWQYKSCDSLWRNKNDKSIVETAGSEKKSNKMLDNFDKLKCDKPIG